MNPIFLYLIFGIIIFITYYLARKLWAWLSIDPRDPHQIIPDERFRQAKGQDKILANGFVDNEER